LFVTQVELNVSVDAIPEALEIDLSELNIGDSAHISDVKLPVDCKPTITDRDFTIVTIASPTLAIVDEVEGEGEEGEAPVAAEEGAEEATEEGGE